MRYEIGVRLQVEGTHRWEGASDVKGVEFLAHPHRHIFHVNARKAVEHSDRDVEFILFKREIQLFLSAWSGDFGKLSCEQIAEKILKRFKCTQVEVSEDLENYSIAYAE